MRVECSSLVLESCYDALDGGGEIGQRDGAGTAAHRKQGRFVDQVRQISACKSRGHRGNLVEVRFGGELDLASVNAARHTVLSGPVDPPALAVEAPGSQQCRVQYLRAVGSPEDDDTDGSSASNSRQSITQAASAAEPT